MSLGLALSGGGSKGAAHIGVLQALKEENINIDYISGTSSGSIIAALYTVGYEPNNLLKFFSMYCNQIGDYDKMVPLKAMGTLFTGKIGIKGLAKGENLEYIINNFCRTKGITNINQIKMPLAIPAVDVNTGEIIYFLSKSIEDPNNISRDFYDDVPAYKYTGNIASIVRASSSFPGVFDPKIIDNRILVDGGVRVNTPVSILKNMGADKVIAINFDKNKKYTDNNLNIISVAMKAFDIMGHQVDQYELHKADLVITPKIPSNVSLLDCSKSNILAQQGYKATKEVIEKIKEIN